MSKSIGPKRIGPHIDKKNLDSEHDRIAEQHDRIRELGDNFNRDLNTLDACIERVEQSGVSDADKRDMLSELMAERAFLQQQYDREVTEAAEKFNDEIRDEIARAEAGGTIMRDQAENARSIDFQAGDERGLEKAAKEADSKAEEFERQSEAFKADLKSRMDMMERQRRQMMRDRASGRF